MQKQEFEERIERTVTDEQYKVIEEVYMWHPSMPRKEQTNEYSLQEDDKPRVNQYPGGNEERTWH